jgi:hypothetical protein
MTTVTVIVVVVVLAVLAAAAYAMYQKQRSTQLRERFGPEYERAVEEAPNRRQAEARLAGVAHRRDQLDLRDLDDAERTRYSQRWDVVQATFVDSPAAAVDQAETLISTVMRERGYPVDDFEERADLVAADHPEVVQHYREAHGAHERYRSDGQLETEDLRQAFVHYRALFAALVHPDAVTPELDSAERPDRVDPATDRDEPDRDVTTGSTDTTDTDVTTDRGVTVDDEPHPQDPRRTDPRAAEYDPENTRQETR